MGRVLVVVATVLLVAALLLLASPVRAQSSAAAQVLFDEGVALRNEGKLEEACAKFDESLRLDPEVGTRFNLADCYARIGKVASAWSHFLQVAADTERAGESARAEAARERAKTLQPRLSRLVIVPRGNIAGLVVKRDGVVVGQAQWSVAVPVDPGIHRVEASAPGHAAWKGEIEVSGEGETFTLEVPVLAESATPAGPVKEDPGPPPDDGGVSTGMVLGLTLGGVGLVGIGLGTAFGVVAINKKNEVDELCPDYDNCTVEGIAINDEAKTASTISTIGFIAGGVLLVGGIVLWIALPGSSDTALRLGPGSLGVGGRF